MKEMNGVIVGQKHNCCYRYGRMRRKCSTKDGEIHISVFVTFLRSATFCVANTVTQLNVIFWRPVARTNKVCITCLMLSPVYE